MTGPTFEDLEEQIEDELDAFVQQLEGELDDFTAAAEKKARRWVEGIVAGDLSLEEFKELIEGEKAILEMSVLQQKVNTKALAGVIKNIVLEKIVEVVERVMG